MKLAERIGNQGRARFAEEQGWTKVVGSQARGIVQGPDAVYWDPRAGSVRVLEAKGGSSQLKTTYQVLQGTNTNTIRSAKTVLLSEKASEVEKLAAARVIKAAQQNRLQTGVVRTTHVLGKPDAPQLDGSWNRDLVSKGAFEIQNDLVSQKPELAGTFRKAEQALRRDMWKFRAAQGVAVLGLAGAAGVGWDAYQQSHEAWSMIRDPSLRGTPLPYIQGGLASARVGEAVTLGLGSAAELGLMGNGGVGAFGRAAGKRFLPVAVVAESFVAAKAYYEFSSGRISQRDFYRRTTGPAIFGVFTTGGAIIGCVAAGGTTLGTATVPGAMVGAGIGGTVAIAARMGLHESRVIATQAKLRRVWNRMQ